MPKSFTAILLIAAMGLSAGSLALATETLPPAAMLSGSAEIIDGDTLRLGPVTVRIHGIDAPEADQYCAGADGKPWHCGRAATDRIAELTEGWELDCTPTDRDHYGRIVAVCRAGGRDIGETLVAEGLAWAFLRYAADYADIENEARASGHGIWQAHTEPAWDFRADRWERAAAQAPRSGCPIKGNISRDGERIYHTPWSPAYGRTGIDEAKGERWFCDEAEAIAAGWRAPRRR